MVLSRYTRVALGVCVLSLTACHPVGPDYKMPKDAIYSHPDANGKFIDTHNPAISANAPLPENWWELYHDATLNMLVSMALEKNMDLRIASANLRKSQAVYDQARRKGGFGAGIEADGGRTAFSGQSYLMDEPITPMNVANLMANISYEFDAFGKIKRGIEAAQADDEAVKAAYDVARVNVVTQVTGSYMDICNANEQLTVANHALDVQRRSLEVTRRMVAAGRETPTELATARTQVSIVQAAIPPLTLKRKVAEYQLSTLLAQTPGNLPAGVSRCATAPSLAQPLPVGDGQQLLARRPDIREAERKLASATALIGVAKADLYPQISFGVSGGYIGKASSFSDPDTRQWSLGPLISWQVPTSGTYAHVREMKEGANVAFGQFDKTVLNALQEVQTSLDQYAQDIQRMQYLQDARNQANLAYEQNERRYQAGREPYLTSLDARRTLVQADMALAAQRAQVIKDQVQLFLALGGGWQVHDQSAASSHASNQSSTANREG